MKSNTWPYVVSEIRVLKIHDRPFDCAHSTTFKTIGNSNTSRKVIRVWGRAIVRGNDFKVESRSDVS